ncbi:MAG: hypothetical protein QM541_08265 [Flavobacterium sp.]|nr:hypothetical protein [Flavobacterium sp.]
MVLSVKSQSIETEDIDASIYYLKVKSDSGLTYVNFSQNVCKGYFFEQVFVKKMSLTYQNDESKSEIVTKKVLDFLNVKGYISYEYYYNQRIDTPIASSAYQQHTISGQLKFTLKNRYPFNVSFTTRQTNNPFFNNFFDLGFVFDKYAFTQLRREHYLKRITVDKPLEKAIKSNQQAIKKMDSEYNDILKGLDEKTITQAIVHEREQLLEARFKKSVNVISFYLKDSVFKTLKHKSEEFQVVIPGDTVWQKHTKEMPKWIKDTVTKTPTEKWYEAQIQRINSLKSSMEKLLKYNDSINNATISEKKSFETSFGDYGKWKIHKQKYGEKRLDKNDKFSSLLDNIKSIGIGRSNVDYSDLTVRNLNLTGLQIEYQPNLYYAIAAGRIDYSFRDFFMANNNLMPKQEFYIARLGLVRDNKASLIVSSFAGKKNSYLSNNYMSNYFTGYSLLTKFFLKDDSYIECEFAKTSPTLNSINRDKPAKLFGFSDNSNMAIAAKISLNFDQTHTLLNGNYRKIGYAFQSINLFSNTLNQSAWSLKLEQKLFKNSIKLTAALRKNDFNYPSVTQNFNTNTVFKTLKVDLRQKAFFLSVGYFPGTQLIKLDSNKIVQNLYYMFNSTGGYTKKIGSFYSSTIVNYNEFINQSSDTGFVYYNGKSFQVNQSFSSNNLVLQAGFTLNKQQTLNYFTIESSVEISKIKWLSVGFGFKYNKIKSGNSYWGGTGNATITIGHWATIRASYDQLFIPSKNNELSKADLGRIILIKYL